MFCHKCGTEIPSEDASFCINCREPLLKIPSSTDRPQTSTGSESQGSSSTSVNLAFGDDDEALKMSDPIDFLMQENEEEEKRKKELDRYKEEFQNGFQDEIQDEVDNGIQDQSQEEARDDYQSENQEAVQDGFQDKIPDEIQEGFQGEIRDDNQPADHDSVKDSHQEQIPDEIQEGFQEGYQEEIQNHVQGENQDDVHAESEDKIPESVQNELQDNTREDVHEEVQGDEGAEQEHVNQDVKQDSFQDSAKEQTPAEQVPPAAESTNRPDSYQQSAPPPSYVKEDAGISGNVSYNAGGQSQQAVGTITKKQEEKVVPPLMEVPEAEDPNKGENIIATAKLKVEKPKGGIGQDLKYESSTSKLKNLKQPSDPTSLDIAKIRRSTGIAYLSGNSLTLAGGPKITQGERIQIGENAYEVKLKPKNRNELYALIGSIALSIFITLYILGAFSSSQYGSLVGMVVGLDSRPISGQEVRIKETGDKFTTNSAGLFIFDGLSEGIYTVEYLMDDEVVGEERITVLGGKTSTLRLSRNSSRSRSEVPDKPAVRQKTENVVTVASSANKPAAEKKKNLAS